MPTCYYVSMRVADRPGVLAGGRRFSQAFGEYLAVRQEGAGDDARLIVVTHRTPDRAQSETVAALENMDAVIKVSSVLRMEGTDD